MEQEYSDLNSLRMKITQSETHIKQAKINIEEANRMLQELKERVTHLNRLHDIFFVKDRGDFNIDELLDYYKTRYPLHRPFIYWKSLIDMLYSIEKTDLKTALKRHECCKYVRWQLEPPKSKKKDETSCKHS